MIFSYFVTNKCNLNLMRLPTRYNVGSSRAVLVKYMYVCTYEIELRNKIHTGYVCHVFEQ